MATPGAGLPDSQVASRVTKEVLAADWSCSETWIVVGEGTRDGMGTGGTSVKHPWVTSLSLHRSALDALSEVTWGVRGKPRSKAV